MADDTLPLLDEFIVTPGDDDSAPPAPPTFDDVPAASPYFEGQYVGPIAARALQKLKREGVADPLTVYYTSGQWEADLRKAGGKNNKAAADKLAAAAAAGVAVKDLATWTPPKLTPAPKVSNIGRGLTAANETAASGLLRTAARAVGGALGLIFIPGNTGRPGQGNLEPDHEFIFPRPTDGSDPQPRPTPTPVGDTGSIDVVSPVVFDDFVISARPQPRPSNRPALDVLADPFADPFTFFSGRPTASPLPSARPEVPLGVGGSPLPAPRPAPVGGVRPAPRNTPREVPEPVATPAPAPAPAPAPSVPIVPDVLLPFDPLVPAPTAPAPVSAPLPRIVSPLNPFAPFQPNVEPFPVPKEELDRCNCKKPKSEKKKPKPRATCKQYVVKQKRIGSSRTSFKSIPCT